MSGWSRPRLSDRALRRLAWVTPVTLVAVFIAAALTALARPSSDGGSWEGGGTVTEVLFFLVILTFPLTGLLIIRRQPRNTVGWVLQGVGAAWGLTGLTDAYAAYGLVVSPGSLPGADVAAALSAGGWAPGIGIMGTFLLLLYPDGRLPSRRWRAVAWLSAVTITVVTTVIALSPGPIGVSPSPELPNPLGLEAVELELRILLAVFLPLLPVCILASAAGLLRRFRRSQGVERLQLKWLATAGSVVALTYLCAMAGSLPRIDAPVGQPDPSWLAVVQSLSLLSFALLPLSIGAAILRYRLYDIDLVINRALVYGSLTALLGGLYLGSVLLLQVVLQPVTARSDLAVAASTLAVAAAFRPARSRVQGWVDRRFYRRRFDAARTVASFTGRLRQEVDLDAVADDLRSVVRDTVAPAHLSLWIRP